MQNGAQKNYEEPRRGRSGYGREELGKTETTATGETEVVSIMGATRRHGHFAIEMRIEVRIEVWSGAGARSVVGDVELAAHGTSMGPNGVWTTVNTPVG